MTKKVIKVFIIFILSNILVLFLLNYTMGFYYWDIYSLDRIEGFKGFNRIAIGIFIPIFAGVFTSFPGFWGK